MFPKLISGLLIITLSSISLYFYSARTAEAAQPLPAIQQLPVTVPPTVKIPPVKTSPPEPVSPPVSQSPASFIKDLGIVTGASFVAGIIPTAALTFISTAVVPTVSSVGYTVAYGLLTVAGTAILLPSVPVLIGLAAVGTVIGGVTIYKYAKGEGFIGKFGDRFRSGADHVGNVLDDKILTPVVSLVKGLLVAEPGKKSVQDVRIRQIEEETGFKLRPEDDSGNVPSTLIPKAEPINEPEILPSAVPEESGASVNFE